MKTIALVGCGRISKRHVQVVTQLPGLRLVAVCDLIEDLARETSQPLGIPYYTDALEMVTREKPDIVSILTESGTHPLVGSLLAPHVKVVVVEKPMALTLDDADQLVETCEAHGTRLFVVKQNRFNPAIQQLRRAVDQNRFGKMVLGTVRVRWSREQDYYDQAPWRGTWKLDGGVFTNQASHHIDLLQWLLGPVESVKSYISTRLVNIEAEDTGVAVLKFKSGALGVIEATTATRPKDLEGSISILGEKGSVVVGGFSVNRMVTWSFTDPTPEDEAAQKAITNPPNVYGFGHQPFYEDMLDCLASGRRSMLDGLEGRKSLEIINALYESAATGEEVHLRYVPQSVRLGR
ncbi:Gfo/Idh/MocA family oxidoreductase [Geothrix sp.]|jgi:predicted dehydrogenase|uniref:Gfo/Idh/MocA family protein n=1 Tax=Geothrix sp. TaxID=1962974 RepID=UPI0025B92538|nr:Gfo/Idh/MocA family oxidoreductase [Geothrix sp.]